MLQSDWMRLRLRVLHDEYCVIKLPAGARLPGWAVAGLSQSSTDQRGELFFVARTSEELSILCPVRHVPTAGNNRVSIESGFRALVVEGPLPFEAVGILASLSGVLAEAGIPILAISTFDTDYLLIRELNLELAVSALAERGHQIEYVS